MKLHNRFTRLILPLLLFTKLFVVNAQTISGGAEQSFVICNNNEVQAWGYNEHGELGNGAMHGYYPLPGQVSGLTDIIAVAGGTYHTLALQNNGTVWAWGKGSSSGALGNGTFADTSLPVKVLSLTNVKAIAAGEFHSLALKNDSTVWGWGAGLANGTGTTSTVRVQISSLSGIVAIAAKGYNSLALKSDGTVWAWGENGNGQLGDSTTTTSLTPLKIPNLNDVIAIASGVRHSLALKSDGTVWAWGNNDFGALGSGDNAQHYTPVMVNNLTGVTAIAGGGSIYGDVPDLLGFSFAIKNDGTLWSWGYNAYGKLGTGTSGASIVPVQVFSLTDVKEVAAGGGHALALQNDGSIWSWGYNNRGQLGNGSTTFSTIPVLVTTACQGLNGVAKIDEQTTLSVNPNPFSVSTTLHSDNFLQDATLTVYNSFGQIVNQIRNITGQSITLQRDNLPAGLYFVYITQNNKAIATTKLAITGN